MGKTFNLRKFLEERVHLFAHSQNLNTSYIGGKEQVVGSMLRHGRAWLHYGRASKNVGVEWQFWPKYMDAHIAMQVGGDETDLSFGLNIFVARFHLGFNHLFPSSWKWHDFRSIGKGITRGFIPGTGRITDLSWHKGRLALTVWRDWTGWNNNVPGHWGGFEWTLHVTDFLLGAKKYNTEKLSVHKGVEIPMPERTYQADILFERATWKRPRWPAKEVRITGDVQFYDPIPFPGKGENAWDCGEDARDSMTVAASTVHDAIGIVVARIMHDRLNYGGVTWRPAKKAEEDVIVINAGATLEPGTTNEGWARFGAAVVEQERNQAQG